MVEQAKDNSQLSPNPKLGIRSGCCEKWPKPCGYHDGWMDGYEAAFAYIISLIEAAGDSC